MSERVLTDRIPPLGIGLCIGLVLVVLYTKFAGGGADPAGLADAEAAFANKDYPTALTLLKPLAEKGVAKAQHRLATQYQNGLGVAPDDAEAVKWEVRAASQGYARAQTGLGNIFLNGIGVRPDDKQAMVWFQQAADQGDSGGQYFVGYMYGAGRAVGQDDDEAMNWYRKAAEQDNPYAQYTLGVLYANGGKNVAKDYNEALNWFSRAAQNGDDTMKKAVREILASIEREDAGVTQLLSTLNMYELKMLIKTMSIMNCGQPISSRYSIKNFVQDPVFLKTPWPQRVEIATKISSAKCGASGKPTEVSLFE